MHAETLKSTIATLRNDLLNSLLSVMTIVGALAVAASLFRYFDIGWNNIMAFHLVILAILIGVTVYRQKMPYAYKAGFIVALFFLTALAGLLSFGLFGGNLGIWFSLPFFAAALISLRAAVVMIGLAVVIFMVVGVLSIQGIIHNDIDYVKMAHSPTVWLNLLVAMPLFTYIPVLFADRLQGINEKLMDQLNTQNAELARLNDVKDRMFSVIAHDLRSPFMSLIGLLELLQQDADSMTKEQLADCMPRLLKDVKGTHGMLENLLLWAHSELEDSTLEVRQQDVHSLVAEAILPFMPIAASKNITIDLQIEPSLQVVCDAVSIKIVISNLLSNAIKFSHSGSTITLSAMREANGISIAVHDTGVGISAEHIEKILDVGQTYTSWGTHNEKGVGLGMKICQKLIRRNGGALHISSVPDAGTTVTLSLP